MLPLLIRDMYLINRATSATPQIVVFAGIQDRRRHESLSESGNRVATPGGERAGASAAAPA